RLLLHLDHLLRLRGRQGQRLGRPRLPAQPHPAQGLTTMSRYTAIESAETMAFMRAVVTGEKNLAVRSEDRLARYFLSRQYPLLIGISLQAMLREGPGDIVPGR